MVFLIITIVLAVDWLLNRNPRPRTKEAPILANRVAQLEEEQRQPRADLVGVHSIEWDAKTRKVVDIQFEEVTQ